MAQLADGQGSVSEIVALEPDHEPPSAGDGPCDVAVAHDEEDSDETGLVGMPPRIGDEVLVSVMGTSADGSVKDRNPMKYEVGSNDLGSISRELEKKVVRMTKGDQEQSDFGEPAADGATLTMRLDDIYRTRDVSFSDDRAVLKKRLCAGSGKSNPQDGATVKLKVEAATDGLEPLAEFKADVLEFVLGNGEVCDALIRAETSVPILIAEPRLGLANITVERVELTVELADFEVIDERRMTADTAAQLLQFGLARKEVGTALFKSGRTRLALQRYRGVATLFADLECLSDESRSKAAELKKLCELNQAACHLKLKEFVDAKFMCDAVLQGDADNVKALYRRAQAEFALEQFSYSISDCRQIVAVDAGNKEARLLLKQAQDGARNAQGLAGKLRNAFA